MADVAGYAAIFIKWKGKYLEVAGLFRFEFADHGRRAFDEPIGGFIGVVELWCVYAFLRVFIQIL